MKLIRVLLYLSVELQEAGTQGWDYDCKVLFSCITYPYPSQPCPVYNLSITTAVRAYNKFLKFILGMYSCCIEEKQG